MKRKKYWLVGAVMIATAFVATRPQRPPASPVVMSHYRLTLLRVTASPEWGASFEKSSKQVWVTVQVDQADNYYDSSGNRPERFNLMPWATLVSKDGTPLKLLDMRDTAEQSETLKFVGHSRSRAVQYVYNAFHADGHQEAVDVTFVFDNSDQKSQADFEADVHLPAYDMNGTRNAEQPPLVRSLRYSNLTLP